MGEKEISVKKKCFNGLYYIGIISVLFIFFYIAHPLILFNADDWYYASYWRRPLPIIGGYNAIKVFPETFMPLVSEFGAFVIFPLVKDYIQSMALAYAFVLVLFIIAFLFLLEKLLDHFTNNNMLSKSVSFLTLIFGFLIYKNDWYHNEHLFYAQDVTCVFHYTIPALLNLCLVLFFLTREVVRNNNLSRDIIAGEISKLHSGLIIMAVYLAVFSNMFSNIILVTYSGVSIIATMIKLRKRFDVKELFSSAWIHISIVFMFLLAIVLQLMDPRNADVAKQGMTTGLLEAIIVFGQRIMGINKMLILVICAIIIAAIIICLVNNRAMKSTHARSISIDTGNVNSCHMKKVLVFLGGSEILTTIYLILLASVSGRSYLKRTDVLIGVLGYLFIILAILIAFVFVKKGHVRRGIILLPLLVMIITSQTMNYCKSYADYNVFNLSYEEAYAASNDIVEQFIQADQEGLTKMTLDVTTNEKWNNIWPYPSYVGDAISDTLYRHGIIRRYIECDVVYDEEKNKELGIYY